MRNRSTAVAQSAGRYQARPFTVPASRVMTLLTALLMLLLTVCPALLYDAAAEQITTPTDLNTPAPTEAPKSGKRSGYALIRSGAKVYTSRNRSSRVGTVTADSYVYIPSTAVASLTYKIRFDTSFSVGTDACHTYYVLADDVRWLSESEAKSLTRQLEEDDVRRSGSVLIPVVAFEYRNTPATPKPTATPKTTPTPKPTATPVPTQAPTATPALTNTPAPTATPEPTATPVPTATPRPSRVPIITPTPRPGAAARTATPAPTLTPAPTSAPTATPNAVPKPEATTATPVPSRVPIITPSLKPTATAVPTPELITPVPTAVPVPEQTPTAVPTVAVTMCPDATPVPDRVPIITPAPALSPEPSAEPVLPPVPTAMAEPTATPAPAVAPGIATGTDLTPPAPVCLSAEEMRSLLDETHPDRQVTMWSMCSDPGYPNGSTVTLFANVSGYDGLGYVIVWEVDKGDGEGYVNAGADGQMTLSFVINDENLQWLWRVGVSMPYMERE